MPEETVSRRSFIKKTAVAGSLLSFPTIVPASNPRIIPATKMTELRGSLPPKTLLRVEGGHYKNWVRACKGLEKPQADFQYGAAMTEICLLGNVAKRFPGNKLRWDKEAMAFTNHAEANEWVKRPRRQGWEI